jgi:peptide/nickel transport system substrate-binding protein
LELQHPFVQPDSITIKYVTENSALVAQYEAGDIDYMKVQAPNVETFKEWEANGDLKMVETISHGYSWLGFNQRLDMFADKETRQAITHALDRETIIEGVVMGRGEVAHAPASPLSWAYSDDVPEFGFDPEKAKQLLAEAGWEEGADGILERDGERFSFELKTNQGNEVRENLIVVIQSQLAAVGIEVDPQIVEWSSFVDQVESHDFEGVVLGWNLSLDPDPRAIWHSDSAENDLNDVGYSNEEVDALIEQSERMTDEEERQEVIQEIMTLIAEDQGYTFLFYDLDDFALPTNMYGYTPHPRANMYKANEWWLDQDEE